MKPFEDAAKDVAFTQRHVVSRAQLLKLGAKDTSIRRRVQGGRWIRRQAGVYQIDGRKPDWRDMLLTAVLAAGEGSLASHRAALVLWGLDGLSSAPIEVTVCHTQGPIPKEVIIHRTRRPPSSTIRADIPVTTVERTLLDCCSLLGPMVMTKAVESAIRKRLTSHEELWIFLRETGGRGVKGTRMLRRILQARQADASTGSGSETEAWYHIRSSDLPEPELQRSFIARDGDKIRPDFYWPHLNKAVEIDGIDAHDSADKLDHDLQRQNKLMDLGIELRRFSARLVRRDPDRFIRDLRDYLEGSHFLGG